MVPSPLAVILLLMMVCALQPGAQRAPAKPRLIRIILWRTQIVTASAPACLEAMSARHDP